MSAHPLDAGLAFETLGAGRFRGAISPAYWNIAGPYGGIVGAALLQGVLLDPALRGRPVAQTANLCAALTQDPFELGVRLVRDGRSTQHWLVELTQNGAIAATSSIVTGPSRATWTHRPAQPPAVPAPEALPVFSREGRTGWTERYEMRFERGAPANPAASADKPGAAETRVWLRDAPERALDYLSLAAMADAFILRLLQVRGALAPSATVTMTTYFTADEAALAAQSARPVLGAADSRVFAHGFHDQSGELWGDDGVLLAVSHQLVWFTE